MKIRIRLNPDAPVSRWKLLMCRLFGHALNVVHDATMTPGQIYRECERCETRINWCGNEISKAERLAHKAKSLTRKAVPALS